MTATELKDFISAARRGEDTGNALLGYVSESTKKEVKNLTGLDVSKIVLEGTSVAHADDPKHNLVPEDLEKCAEVINHPVDIQLAPGKTVQGLHVLRFEGNSRGQIFFLEAVHKKYGGWLSLKTVYRPPRDKKGPSGTPLVNDPGANVQNAPPSAFVPQV